MLFEDDLQLILWIVCFLLSPRPAPSAATSPPSPQPPLLNQARLMHPPPPTPIVGATGASSGGRTISSKFLVYLFFLSLRVPTPCTNSLGCSHNTGLQTKTLFDKGYF
ncbi:MAG: hypothetical protein J3Q66DRAFT_48276 [Benniella sp.]|nr:MAG: hypothetical protein J3Q66DRAFT_48276 [Benniella sp.]